MSNPIRSARPIWINVGSLLAALVMLWPVSIAGAQAAPTKDIVDTAVSAGQFTTLTKALTAAGLVDKLKTGGPYTVFAPTDAAFAKVPADQLNALLANPAALTKVLTYHVVAGQVPAATVVTLTSIVPLEGEPIAINVNSSGVFLNRTSKVIQTDIRASNGLIHAIDMVLLPPSLANAPATPSAPSSGTATVASDGQSLSGQSAATQAMFTSAWGDKAPTQWVTEHNASLAH